MSFCVLLFYTKVFFYQFCQLNGLSQGSFLKMSCCQRGELLMKNQPVIFLLIAISNCLSQGSFLNTSRCQRNGLPMKYQAIIFLSITIFDLPKAIKISNFYLNFFLFLNFQIMSRQQFISCSSYIDYSTRRNCPLYNTDSCPTPDTPILCPMIENEPRSPCTRFICSSEGHESLFSTTTPATTIRQIVSTVVQHAIAAGETASAELQDLQVNHLLFQISFIT